MGTKDSCKSLCFLIIILQEANLLSFFFYVDDIFLIRQDGKMNDKLKDEMPKIFDMKDLRPCTSDIGHANM